MKLIKNIKHIYQINALEAGTNALFSFSGDDDALWKQLNKNQKTINSLKKHFNDDPTLRKMVLADPNLSSSLNFLFNTTPYIAYFAQQDFENAFYLSFGLFSTSQSKTEQIGFGNCAVNALGQIKSQYMVDGQWVEYNTKFHNVEAQLTSTLVALLNNNLTPTNSLVKIDYNGIYTGLAYLQFVEFNISQAEKYLHAQVDLFGQDIVFQKEISPTVPTWFYDTINQENKTKFAEFVFSTLQSTSLASKPSI